MRNKNMHFYESKERHNVILDDQLLDDLAEEFLALEGAGRAGKNFLQWVEFRMWELSNKLN